MLYDGSSLELGLKVAFFASNDLPEIWVFGGVEMDIQVSSGNGRGVSGGEILL